MLNHPFADGFELGLSGGQPEWENESLTQIGLQFCSPAEFFSYFHPPWFFATNCKPLIFPPFFALVELT